MRCRKEGDESDYESDAESDTAYQLSDTEITCKRGREAKGVVLATLAERATQLQARHIRYPGAIARVRFLRHRRGREASSGSTSKPALPLSHESNSLDARAAS